MMLKLNESQKTNSSLKMNIMERMVWFALVLLLGVVMGVGYLPTETPVQTTVETPMVEVTWISLAGYNTTTTLSENYTTIAHPESNATLELSILPESLTVEYLEKKPTLQTLNPGLGAWQFEKHDGWDPSPDSKVEGNSSTTYYLEKDGYIIRAELFDYTGGSLDEEFEKILGSFR